MSLDGLASRSAERAPGAVAVSAPDGRMTYAELDLRAQVLARVLAQEGVRPGDRVVLWSEKSTDLVAATQAVLRLGAAYVPVPVGTPRRRITLVARDCGARALVCSADLYGTVDPAELPGTRLVRLDTARGERPDGRCPRRTAAPGDLAYVLYTSGSTGAPKGVGVSHAAALAFVTWAGEVLAAREDDVFANHASLGFDLSVLDLYAAFDAGARVSMVPQAAAYTPAALVDFLHGEEISVWYSVPSALVLMMRDGGLLDRPPPPSLRAVLFAGEPFPIGRLRALARWSDARLLNLYGPTETNVCAFHEVEPADLERDRPVPIGRASCGDTLRVRRSDGRLAGPGEEGELFVEGPTLMNGYWGRARLRGAHPTGDTVRVLPGGALEFVGRSDSMLKIRGNRVEPGEVEAVLSAHPGVSEAAVVGVGSGLDARLVAYVVPRPPGLGVLSVKRHVAEHLAPHLVPDLVRLVSELPLNHNGKIDRASLIGRAAATTNGSAP